MKPLSPYEQAIARELLHRVRAFGAFLEAADTGWRDGDGRALHDAADLPARLHRETEAMAAHMEEARFALTATRRQEAAA